MWLPFSLLTMPCASNCFSLCPVTYPVLQSLPKSAPFDEGLQLHFQGLLLSCPGHRGPLEIHPHARLVGHALCPKLPSPGCGRSWQSWKSLCYWKIIHGSCLLFPKSFLATPLKMNSWVHICWEQSQKKFNLNLSLREPDISIWTLKLGLSQEAN